MKKTIKLLFILLTMLFLVGCAKKHEVKFSSNGEEKVVSVKDGEKVEKVEPESYADHVFNGWYLDEELFDFNSPITKDIKLVAKWDLVQYEITFLNDDDSLLKQEKVNINEKIVAPTDPTKESDDNYDYTFAGWDKEFDKATSDLVISATYTKSTRKYNITFYGEDKEEIATNKVEKGSYAKPLNITKDEDAMYSYKLKAWCLKSGEEFDFAKPVDKDVKLYPKFERIPVYFNTTGKTVSIMGDSVSTFYKANDKNNSYYSGDNEFYYPRYCSAIDSSSKTWWMQTINGLGAKLGVNNSLSGSSVFGSTSTAGQSNARVNTLGEKGDPDIIITYLGINDNVNGNTTAQFEQAYRTMLDKIIAKYDKAYIFVCTMSYSAYYTKESHYNYSEETRLAYNEILAKLAEEYQIGLIDFAKAVTKDNYNKSLNDNLHYNVLGMQEMAKQAIFDITKYFNQGKELYEINLVVDSDDITLSEEVFSYYQDEVITLPTAKKTGYEFKGWYEDSEFEGAKITTTANLSKDLTLYPKFTPILQAGEFYIEYKLDGGRLVVVDYEALENEFCADYKVFADAFFEKDLEISKITDLGFTVDNDNNWGFVKNAEGTSIAWDKLYYAQRGSETKYCLIEFFKENNVKWGWLLNYLHDVAVSNSASMTLESTWPEPVLLELCGFFRQCQVSWDTNHETAAYGDSDVELNADIYDYYPSVNPVQSGTYTLPTPTKDGYTFDGWYTSKTFEGEKVVSVTSSIKVYAKWVENN